MVPGGPGLADQHQQDRAWTCRRPRAWGTRTQTITIQGSTDGTNYTTLVASAGLHLQPVHRQHRDDHLPGRHHTFNPATGNTATITFPATTVRYIKLTFTANTGWPAGQLSELQVFTS